MEEDKQAVIKVDDRIKLDKGWLKNQARIFLDGKEDNGLLEEFINFLEL